MLHTTFHKLRKQIRRSIRQDITLWYMIYANMNISYRNLHVPNMDKDTYSQYLYSGVIHLEVFNVWFSQWKYKEKCMGYRVEMFMRSREGYFGGCEATREIIGKITSSERTEISHDSRYIFSTTYGGQTGDQNVISARKHRVSFGLFTSWWRRHNWFNAGDDVTIVCAIVTWGRKKLYLTSKISTLFTAIVMAGRVIKSSTDANIN